MKTLIDLFELNAAYTSARPAPVAVAAPEPRADVVDLVDIEIDWEDTFHGKEQAKGAFYGTRRVWASED